MRISEPLFLFTLLTLFSGSFSKAFPIESPKVHSIIIGDVTTNGAIVQYRIENTDPDQVNEFELQWTVKKQKGVSVSEKSFTDLGNKEFLLRFQLTKLPANSLINLELKNKTSKGSKETSHKSQFRTLPLETADVAVSVVHSSCMHFERFYYHNFKWERDFFSPSPLKLEDSLNGFAALPLIKKVSPTLWISNGDNVYYDHPTLVKDLQQMRAKWKQQFSMKRLVDALNGTPTEWLKDDHDFRTDDADTTNEKISFPTNFLGKQVFREQLPVVQGDQLNNNSLSESYNSKHRFNRPLYRSKKLGQGVELFFLEARDYRSPNSAKDDESKTIWGKAQKEWLKESLLKSKAKFKIIITPNPLVGPDDASKKDNHTNIGGFRTERKEFFDFLKANNLSPKDLLFINGDRHWQYHSISEDGFHEFCSGAINVRNARVGRKPGDPKSTDPEGLIQQPFIQPVPVGGFILMDYQPSKKGGVLKIHFISEEDKELYSYQFGN